MSITSSPIRSVLPFDAQPFYREAIVHLPDCFMVHDRRQAVPRALTRADVGLPPDGFVFCSFNHSYKIRAPVFDAWMQLLRNVPGSVLWLLAANQHAAANLRRAAAQRSVDPARLIFAGRVPLDQHLDRQRLADLFLDTAPYNAGATASAALWAGVPLVTCRGASLVGRMAASMLHAVGLPELETANLTDYVALAESLARDPARLQALRQSLGPTEAKPAAVRHRALHAASRGGLRHDGGYTAERRATEAVQRRANRLRNFCERTSSALRYSAGSDGGISLAPCSGRSSIRTRATSALTENTSAATNTHRNTPATSRPLAPAFAASTST